MNDVRAGRGDNSRQVPRFVKHLRSRFARCVPWVPDHSGVDSSWEWARWARQMDVMGRPTLKVRQGSDYGGDTTCDWLRHVKNAHPSMSPMAPRTPLSGLERSGR